MGGLIFLGISFAFVLIVVSGYFKDKAAWNGGICSKTGKTWVLFDRSSQGCRGYADGKGNHVWISWPVDR